MIKLYHNPKHYIKIEVHIAFGVINDYSFIITEMQNSFSGFLKFLVWYCFFYAFLKKNMGPLRFERKTSRLSAERSTWLSYGPETIAPITPSNLNLIFENGATARELRTNRYLYLSLSTMQLTLSGR